MHLRTAAAIALTLALPVVAQRTPRTRPVTQAEVDKITRDAILIDSHDDVTSQTVTGYDIATPNKKGQTDLPRMKGILGAEFFAVYVGPGYAKTGTSAHRALDMIDTVRTDVLARYPKNFVFATTAADIERAHKDHKIAALMGIEGGHAIEDSLRALRDFYALGVRYMTLTHTNTNSWADSQGDIDNSAVQHHNGLTPFGKDVVHEMNRLGMMVDISHVADKTFYDVLETSTAPIIASHSSARAVASAPRNMTDDMIKALAAKGGVMQVNFNCGFLSNRYADEEKAATAKYSARLAEARAITDLSTRVAAIDAIDAEIAKEVTAPTMQDVLAHIDHAVNIGGIDAVGIGTDYDGVSCVPSDLNSYAQFPSLTRALLQKGYTADDIKKIYGGNLLRVMRAVERRAAKLKGTPAIETKIEVAAK